jgi:P-type conjugative transfer protein TrbJ
MRIFSTRRELAACAVAMIALTQPANAQGGAIYCVNCSSEYTQWLNYLKLVDQLEKQAGLLQYAARNTAALSNFTANASVADIRAVTAILRQGQALSYASANVDAQFALKFKDYNGYAALKLDGQTMAAKYQQWSADANAATRTALKAAGAQSQQMEGAEEARIAELEAKAKTTEGALEAQQTALELSVETVRQLQKLRQLVLLNMDLAAKHGQIETDERAVERAEWSKFSKTPGNLSATGGKQYRIGK